MPSAPVKSERRKKLRKKPLRLVYVELAFGNGGMMRDLSEEGFAVRAMMPVKQGDKTPFSFTLGEKARIEGEGRVLWIDEGGRVAGVEFTQIPSAMRSQIDDWLIEDEKIVDPRDTPKEPKIAPSTTLEELRAELRSTPVRSEPPIPATEDQTPLEQKLHIEDQPSAAAPPQEPEPIVEAPPPAEPKIPVDQHRAAKEAAETATGSKQEAQPVSELPKPTPPKLESEPSAAPPSSVTEGFFRKWPKEAPTSAPASETFAPELPDSPLPTFVSAPQRPKRRPSEEEEYEEPSGDRVEDRRPLPDISDILIQPHALSSHPEQTSGALPHLPPAQRVHERDSEWFTLGRALAVMIVLTLLASGIVYHRVIGNGLVSLGEAIGGGSSRVENVAPPNAADSQHGPPATDAREQQSTSPTNPAPAPTISSTPPANTPPSLGSAAKSPSAPVTPLASPEGSPDSGQTEYLQAIQLMKGRNAATDMPEAVRLLWIAVEKGNPNAEVSLADLYWRGRGVAHNCDQARILFTAAARKGSSEAQKRLQQFQQEGCE